MSGLVSRGHFWVVVLSWDKAWAEADNRMGDLVYRGFSDLCGEACGGLVGRWDSEMSCRGVAGRGAVGMEEVRLELVGRGESHELLVGIGSLNGQIGSIAIGKV